MLGTYLEGSETVRHLLGGGLKLLDTFLEGSEIVRHFLEESETVSYKCNGKSMADVKMEIPVLVQSLEPSISG